MRAQELNNFESLPSCRVQIVEVGASAREGFYKCEEVINLKFNAHSLSTYFFSEWDPVMYDALLVAASVEYCDRIERRSAHNWTRHFHLCIPVHDLSRWQDPKVYESLKDALEYLTGDIWEIEFVNRKKEVNRPEQTQLMLEKEVIAVIPFSNGLDSHAVGSIYGLKFGTRLARIRLKAKANNGQTKYDQPFTAVPYSVVATDQKFVESSARSRGFKFSFVTGLVAYLTKAEQVIVTESGQGVLGPVLAPVGQSWEDYRSYPAFTIRMEKFLDCLFTQNIKYCFPQIWSTKGETIKEYINICGNSESSWVNTISCWQQNRQVSVNGKSRQCGICAACMLRRLSVHAAGLSEPKANYVWENLSAKEFSKGVTPAFDTIKITKAMNEYAIAGTLHMAQIAILNNTEINRNMLDMRARELAKSLGISSGDAANKLERLINQHRSEWNEYIDSLGSESFVAKWAKQVII